MFQMAPHSDYQFAVNRSVVPKNFLDTISSILNVYDEENTPLSLERSVHYLDRLRPIVKPFYSWFTTEHLGESYKGIYLLSSDDPTSFHFDSADRDNIRVQGNWDYVDWFFLKENDEDAPNLDSVVNPRQVPNYFYKFKSGLATIGNKSTRVVPWVIGISPPEEIEFGSYDVVFYNQDVFIPSSRDEGLYWRGRITGGLASKLLKPGGLVYAHRYNVLREGKIVGCEPLLNHVALDHCLWRKPLE